MFFDMAYKALYNKYRPQTFEEVVGQKGIVRTLKNALVSGKIAHAYLFSGPRGTGKTTMARLFAKALNCEEGIGKQCNQCSNCLAIMEGNHPDVVEIDAASNNGVDQVRELIEKVRYSPIKGRYKVYIIDEVHMMSQGAFNALLKTLEEPPEDVIFILATTEPFKVLPTILSRCQRFDFQKIDDPEIKANIIRILDIEGIGYEEKAVDEIVNLAEGGMRDALSILEQVLAYSGNKIGEGDVLTLFGLTSNTQKIELLRLAKDGDVSSLLSKLDEFVSGGVDIKRLALSLLDILKDQLIFEKTGDPSLIHAISADEAGNLSNYLNVIDLNRMIKILLKAQADFKNVSNVRSLFELSLLEMASLQDEIPTPAYQEATEKAVKKAQATAPVATPTMKKEAPKASDVPDFVTPTEEVKPVTIDADSVKESDVVNEGDKYQLDDATVMNVLVLGKDNKEDRRELTKKWGQLESLKTHPKVGNLATLLSEGHPFCLCKEALILSFNFTRLKEKANIKANQPAIQEIVSKMLGRKVFVYSLDRLDCNKLYTAFSGLEQLSKLPSKESIHLELPKGEEK